MTTSTKAVQFRMCPKNHYMTLCESSQRFGAKCNTCGRGNLNNVWTCFPCNYDMCLTCYDQNNERPTNQLKFCRQRHPLVYADSTTRGFRRCDICKTTGLLQSYCCYNCDYDMCSNCYNSYKNEGSCNIF